LKRAVSKVYEMRGGMADMGSLLNAGAAAPLMALLHYMEESQWFSSEELEKHQHEQLNLLLEYGYKHSPSFKERMLAAGLAPGDISNREGLSRLPVLTRRDVRMAGESLYCKEVPKSHMPVAITKTSGSTGEPVLVKKTTVTNLFWQANTMRENFWHQRDFRQKVLTVRSVDNQQMFLQNHWGTPSNMLFATGQVMAVPVVWDISRQVQEILAFKPAQLLLYPNNLNAIVDHCERNKIAIGGVEHIWSIAETLSPKIRQKAERFFGCKVEDNYSSQELGVMALQCPESGLYHVMSESVILEVLNDDNEPCKPGETGRVVVTDLHNFATPMVRYGVGDYAEVSEPCPCGRGLPTIKAFLGRERNLIAKPGGVRHWPRINFDECPGIENILQYQLIQHTVEEIEIRLVSTCAPMPQQEAELTAWLHTHMEYPFTFRFNYFEGQLPKGANGKFEEFISHVSAV